MSKTYLDLLQERRKANEFEIAKQERNIIALGKEIASANDRLRLMEEQLLLLKGSHIQLTNLINEITGELQPALHGSPKMINGVRQEAVRFPDVENTERGLGVKRHQEEDDEDEDDEEDEA